jgi:hypothetical protein
MREGPERQSLLLYEGKAHFGTCETGSDSVYSVADDRSGNDSIAIEVGSDKFNTEATRCAKHQHPC